MQMFHGDSWSDINQPLQHWIVSWCEGQCDLYFTVQWLCLIHVSWSLFDGWTSNLWIMSQCDFTWKWIWVTVTCISLSSDFVLHVCLEDWWMNVKHLDTESRFTVTYVLQSSDFFFFLISWLVLIDEYHFWIMSRHNLWPQNKEVNMT